LRRGSFCLAGRYLTKAGDFVHTAPLRRVQSWFGGEWLVIAAPDH